MIKRILPIIIAVSFSSCKKSEFEYLLINPDKKWSYVSSNTFNPNSIVSFYMEFHPNGDLDIFQMVKGIFFLTVKQKMVTGNI
ncbi:hypothetical protein L1276_003788 [Flavobacterium sp. HSC-32F16]|nr:hypothetical protein [Flavobacterium sp. HSC-32F16]